MTATARVATAYVGLSTIALTATVTVVGVRIGSTKAIAEQQVPKGVTKRVSRLIASASIARIARITYVTHSIYKSFLCI